MASPDKVKQLAVVCDELTRSSIDDMVAKPEWGQINFEGARKDFETVFAVANQLKNLPLDLLPDQEIDQLIGVFGQIMAQVTQIRSFTIVQQNPTGARDSIVNSIRGQATQLYVQAQSRIPFLAYQRGDVRRNEEALSRAVADARAALADATKYSKARREEVESIVAAAREASASVGVAHFTAEFGGTATAQENSARVWLTVTGCLALATIAAALAFPFIFVVSGPQFDLHAVQIITSKLVALGALFTATVWCGRMYKATKHQAAMNAHRANALKTFEAFVKATSDDQTRNAVLMETTRSIFAITTTGYLDGSESAGDGALKVMEIIKSAASAGKG